MRLKESRSPNVGPFYVIDGVVYSDADDIRDVDVSPAGFRDSNNGHYDYWRSLQRYYPEYRNVDYDYYPRGRVVYSTKDDKYYLYADKCILNSQKLIDAIEEELNLPYDKVVVGEDEHYQCHECNEDYADIWEGVDPDGIFEDILYLNKEDKENATYHDYDDEDGYGHW